MPSSKCAKTRWATLSRVGLGRIRGFHLWEPVRTSTRFPTPGVLMELSGFLVAWKRFAHSHVQATNRAGRSNWSYSHPRSPRDLELDAWAADCSVDCSTPTQPVREPIAMELRSTMLDGRRASKVRW